MQIEFEQLWKRVSADFHGSWTSLHGPSHWKRVERNGLLLATRTGANETVVRLFALFHDSRRGARGADFALELLGVDYNLTEDQFDLLHYACVWHTDGTEHDDPTIATCWDADRLDLGRVGVTPDPKRMCTAFGREIARAGSVELFLEKNL